MEPSGRNPWQPVATGGNAKTARTGKTVAVGCDQLPIGAHGKEGVDDRPVTAFASQRGYAFIARRRPPRYAASAADSTATRATASIELPSKSAIRAA